MKNTVPFLVFGAKDYPANLATAFQPYSAQITALRELCWQEKTVRVILFGDYEFLCSVYGLSGPSGVRPCLFCLCKKTEFQAALSDRASGTPRSLEQLASNYEQFKKDGSRLANAKEFNNVIRPALLPVPIPDICVPALHLDLGIYVWIFDAMVNDLRSLDMSLAKKLGEAGMMEGDSELFMSVVRSSSELSLKEQQLQQIEAHTQLYEAHVSRLISVNSKNYC